MTVDDVLPSSTDRRWRRGLTTPLVPLFWLAGTTRRAGGALARTLGFEHASLRLARRLSYRRTLDYGTSNRGLALAIDDETLMGPTRPGKTLEDVLTGVVTDEPAGWRGLLRSLRRRTRYETEHATGRVRARLGSFLAGARAGLGSFLAGARAGLGSFLAGARSEVRAAVDALSMLPTGGDDG